ncbi:MAG TPA: hydroxymethylpyrimidine/phosphomethylpyrimidine kinase [Burkholderiales bacterium]|nr:hydroxymethylpyrimidine/phosphomethylpyrimidine kinase [Burkholderiales bacterium]
MSRTAPPPLVLAFAASDPTGGAGIQADILTLAARGCHPLSVMTGVTVQDTHGVRQMRALDADLVAAQARALLEELRVAAFKLGVLASAANAAAIARILGEHPAVPVVVDPVLASGRGDALSDDNLVAALRADILPRATVLTPNSLEARRLAGLEDLAACPARLIEMGCRHVLVTGTHEDTAEVENVLHGAGGVLRSHRWPRLPASYHGSGCTLASALAAALAHGLPVEDAAYDAQAYTWKTLENGFRPGTGQFLPRR